MASGGDASWPWSHVLDLRHPRITETADGVRRRPLPPLPPEALREQREATNPGTGWRAQILSGRRPGTKPAEHDWAAVLTDPEGGTAAVVGECHGPRFRPQEVFDTLPGLGIRLKAPTARDKAHQRATPSGLPFGLMDENRIFWRNVRTLHRLIADPRGWARHSSNPALASGPPSVLRDAVLWASSGLPSLTEAEAWQAIGVRPSIELDGRIPFHAVGFNPGQARAWLPVDSDTVARQWADAGRTAADALSWAALFGPPGNTLPMVGPDHATALESAGWPASRVATLFRVLPAHGEEFTALNTYLGHLLWPHTMPGPTRPWQRLSPQRLLRYVAAGIKDPDQIDAHEASAAPPSDDKLAVLGALRMPDIRFDPRGDLLSLASA